MTQKVRQRVGKEDTKWRPLASIHIRKSMPTHTYATPTHLYPSPTWNHSYMHTREHPHTHTHTQPPHTCSCSDTSTCRHTHKHTYSHAHIHTHTLKMVPLLNINSSLCIFSCNFWILRFRNCHSVCSVSIWFSPHYFLNHWLVEYLNVIVVTWPFTS